MFDDARARDQRKELEAQIKGVTQWGGKTCLVSEYRDISEKPLSAYLHTPFLFQSSDLGRT